MELYTHIQNAFPLIEARFTPKNLACFAACRFEALEGYRAALALCLGAQLLGNETPLYSAFVRAGVARRDDMAQHIITLFYFHVRTRDS